MKLGVVKLPKPAFLGSLLLSRVSARLAGNATALALRKAPVRPSCLGAFHNFFKWQKMSGTLRSSQKQPGCWQAACHYRPNAPKRQA